MRKIVIVLSIFSLGILIPSCGGPSKSDKKTELKTRIKEMEDSIMVIQKDPMKAAKMPSLTNIELINRLLAYYQAFPTDSFSADCLFKVHMKYSDVQAYEQSVAYGDTLLQLFPTYKNRDFLIESLAGTYEALIEPRNEQKIEYYYRLLLKEKLTASKRKEIENRLEHIEMDFFEYSQLKMTGQ